MALMAAVTRAGSDAPADYRDALGLQGLMERTSGAPEVRIGLIDGPIALGHPSLAGSRLETWRVAAPMTSGEDLKGQSPGLTHGTFIAGILCGPRGGVTPALCPGCTVISRPVFAAGSPAPSATAEEVGGAVRDCLGAGARLINLSAAMAGIAREAGHGLRDALDAAMAKGVLVIASAGNWGTIGGTPIIGHPWVIPVTARDRLGRPPNYANLGHSIGRRGLSAPGEGIVSLTPGGGTAAAAGTSVATALVSGAIALIWSVFPGARAVQIRQALDRVHPRRTIVPPMLEAGLTLRMLVSIMGGTA